MNVISYTFSIKFAYFLKRVSSLLYYTILSLHFSLKFLYEYNNLKFTIFISYVNLFLNIFPFVTIVLNECKSYTFSIKFVYFL